jgi:hypothetical protein
MKPTVLLKNESNRLRHSISLLIQDFIKNNGECDIQIDCQCSFAGLLGEKKLVDTNVTVEIGV